MYHALPAVGPDAGLNGVGDGEDQGGSCGSWIESEGAGAGAGVCCCCCWAGRMPAMRALPSRRTEMLRCTLEATPESTVAVPLPGSVCGRGGGGTLPGHAACALLPEAPPGGLLGRVR